MDKKALQEQFEEFARWYVLPLDKSEDGIYRALETQSAWAACQHQQAKVEELQTLYTQQGINMLKLQKQIDALEKSYFVLARIKSIASKNLLESILIKEVRQALKGEG